MILFPAIDLKDGQCVRLKLGEMSAATVFNDDPAAQALAFERQGFKYLHIVDLNGAFAGRPVNGAAVEAILEAITIPAQLGGGIRDLETIEAWLDRGIRRVILGTVAVRDPNGAHLSPIRIQRADSTVTLFMSGAICNRVTTAPALPFSATDFSFSRSGSLRSP